MKKVKKQKKGNEERKQRKKERKENKTEDVVPLMRVIFQRRRKLSRVRTWAASGAWGARVRNFSRWIIVRSLRFF